MPADKASVKELRRDRSLPHRHRGTGFHSVGSFLKSVYRITLPYSEVVNLRLLRYFTVVAEERNVGRAATRLRMTQPPLSRAIKQLETDLGVVLFERTTNGVTLTPAGEVLQAEARELLERAERVRSRVAVAGRSTSLTIGTLVDSAEQTGGRLAATFRTRHPGIDIRIREADLADPTTGLRAGLVDVALTRAPFTLSGISYQMLRSDPVGVVLRADDPLTVHETLTLGDLADRRWFQFPEGTDPIWCAYWNGDAPVGTRREGPVVRTVTECLQAVLWNGTIGLTPLVHALPEGLATVPLTDMPPSRTVVAWNTGTSNPLVRSLVEIARDIYG